MLVVATMQNMGFPHAKTCVCHNFVVYSDSEMWLETFKWSEDAVDLIWVMSPSLKTSLEFCTFDAGLHSLLIIAQHVPVWHCGPCDTLLGSGTRYNNVLSVLCIKITVFCFVATCSIQIGPYFCLLNHRSNYMNKKLFKSIPHGMH